MNRFLAVALLAFLGIALVVGCGGGDNGTVRFGGEEIPRDELPEGFSDDLPDSFPDDFPVYDDADFEGSYEGEQEGLSGLVALWRTGDSVEDVTGFYETELEGSEWDVQTSGNTGPDSGFIFTMNQETGQVGAVYIGREEDDTIITVIIGDDAGAADDSLDDGQSDGGNAGSVSDGALDGNGSGDGASAGGDLPPEQELPDDFPSDRVPLPDDIHVSSASSLSSDGTTTHYVEFYSERSANELQEFFQDELPASGWTESLASNTDGDVFLSFAPEGDMAATEGVTIIITESGVEGYRIVTLSVFAG